MATTNDSFQALLELNTNVSNVLKQINVYKNNPSAIQRVIINHFDDITQGKIDIVDPTSPFAMLMDCSAVNTAAFIIDNEATSRKEYPALAQTEDDLYRHMSDTDYLDRFATPSTTTITVLVNETELLGKLEDDPVTGIPTATIPRNTTFTVAGVTFSMQYPINIQRMAHGALQITYDASNVSPLQTLTTNIVPWSYKTPVGSNDNYIALKIQVYQFLINSVTASMTIATGSRQVIPLTDLYCYSRVYFKAGNATTWTEIKTTHTDQVYDIQTPTVALKVIDGALQVSVPQIYLDAGLLSGTIRTDVYETKGVLNMVLENYSPDAFEANWYAIDSNDNTPAAAVFPSLRAMMIYSSDYVSGGSNALTFEALRAQVINNSIGERQIPITNVQIQTKLQKPGYQVVADVDVVTNRIFLATKSFPDPVNTSLLTAAATSIQTLTVSAKSIVNYPGVFDNTTRVTISPDLVYRNLNGLITPVTGTDYANLTSKQATGIAQAVTTGNYVYTPFHYVLDMSSNLFQVRPYYLDSPKTIAVTFVDHNDTTGIQVNTGAYSIARTSTGYQLSLITTSDQTYKNLTDAQVYAFLAYKPPGETDVAYLAGEIAAATDTGERIFQFDIKTNFDIDSNHRLQLTSFNMFDTTFKTLPTELGTDFTIFYATNGGVSSNWETSTIDASIPAFLSLPGTVGITQEQIEVNFGVYLDTLWSRSRSNSSATPFRTYTQNIPLIYTEDVYTINPETGGRFTINTTAQTLTSNRLHVAGDPVLDPVSGQPVFKHKVGDIVLDNNGYPVLEGAASILRSIDMMFIDGAYRFATDAAAVAYRQYMIDTVVGWLTTDLEVVSKELLEQTNLYFYPKTTMGQIPVMIEDGITTSIEAGQSFMVNLYVTTSVYSDLNLRKALTKSTITTIANLLKESQVSGTVIQNALKDVYGNDVISLNVTGLGGSSNLSTLTVINDSNRCAIAKQLVALPDGTLVVQENVTVNFIKHELPVTTVIQKTVTLTASA